MGPKNSCEYADCAMDEIDTLVNCDTEHGPPHRPAFWGRLRDDIYMAWTGTVEQLLEFMTWLNGIHPDLVFTYDYSTEGVEFLDTFVYAVGSVVHTRLYSKPSDTHCYLIPTSCHRTHVLKNIPYGVARRVRQNSSEDTQFLAQRRLSTQHLLDRGYHPDLICSAFDKFSDVAARKDLYSLKDKSDKATGMIPMVMDHNPALPNMGSIIHKHKHILQLDPGLAGLIPSDCVFVSYRKNKTIGDMLVHNRFRSSEGRDQVVENVENLHPVVELAPGDVAQVDDDVGCFACEKCYVCRNKFLTPCSQFTSYHSEQIFYITKKLTCQSTNIIYLMECNTCKRSTVGYATTTLPLRFSNYKCHIKRGIRTCQLVNHFIDIDHSIDFSTTESFNRTLSAHLTVIIVDTVDLTPDMSKAERVRAMEAREGFYQTQLKTLTRFGGMNTLDSHHNLIRSGNI